MNRWDQLMGLALSEARRAGSHGDVPVGAVVVDQNGTLLAAARNERELTGDPTAHAEVVALRAAARVLSAGTTTVNDAAQENGSNLETGTTMASDAPQASGVQRASGTTTAAGHLPLLGGTQSNPAWRLSGCTVIVTLEPCLMCAGALLAARVDRLVLGAWDAKAGACGSVWDVVRDAQGLHQIEVIPGVRAAESAALLAEFFAERR
ncbi:MAG: nucleoside deaminase [Promicromonosporaceae bacterium]|nr:nucleoside deaminase [Promicromonosporaceae bacterium]